MKIYSNLAEARAACEQFAAAYARMSEDMGITLEIDDSCVGSWFTASYLDENGIVRRYFHD